MAHYLLMLRFVCILVHILGAITTKADRPLQGETRWYLRYPRAKSHAVQHQEALERGIY